MEGSTGSNEYSIIEAQRHDAVYEFKRSINAFLAVLSQARIGSGHYYADHQLSPAEQNYLRGQKLFFLTIPNSAPNDVIKGARLFKRVCIASIQSNANNASYLKDLASNYPDLQGLCISQDHRLSDEELQWLAKFRRLKMLQLQCSPANTVLFAKSLPRSVQHLLLWSAAQLPNLPNLQELRVHQCAVDETFLQSLNAPRLERLYFNWVHLKVGSLTGIGKFSNLKQLELYNSYVDPAEFQKLRRFPYLRARIWNEPIRLDESLNKADKLFEDKKFREAIWPYVFVFTRPSVHGYLQRARCYLALGQYDDALRECDHALDFAPLSASTHSVREEIKNASRSRP